MSDRDKIVERLRQDLLGPMEGTELLQAYPSDVYLTGILFPPRSEIPAEENDQQLSEGGGTNDGNEGNDEISLASVKRPATAGLSFVVESETVPIIDVEFSAGIYRRQDIGTR